MVEQKRILPDRPMTWLELRRRWVANNPEKALDINRQARARQKEKVARYKEARGCADCGNSDHRVLDLHHRDGADKEDAVSVMRVRAAWKRVAEEMDKCDVLCANCHRIRHATEVDESRGRTEATGVFFRAS